MLPNNKVHRTILSQTTPYHNMLPKITTSYIDQSQYNTIGTTAECHQPVFGS